MNKEQTTKSLRQAKQLKAKIQGLTKSRTTTIKGSGYKTSVRYSNNFNEMIKLADVLKPIEQDLINSHIGYMPFLHH